MHFRAKLLALTMTGILLVGIIPLAITGLRRGQLRDEIMAELNLLGRSECSKVAKDVYLMLRAQHEKLKKEVHHDLNVAEYVLAEAGGISLAQEDVAWKATNQSSREAFEINLKKVNIGDRWIGQNLDPAVSSPIVDKVQQLVGAKCTIFQRMNENGDLLRICTNVCRKNGTRAIGTYIPAKEPNGTVNAVVAAILQGQTYVGRAYVVDNWYLTAYKPIFDAQQNVIGALFCGVRLEDIPELREGIVDITAGRTGYAYVLGGSGEQKGRYIISWRGLRDGENIYDSQDASGKYFIRTIIEKALQTQDGECQYASYAWQNPGEASPRQKVVATTYFEPWDWVIGVGAYEDDFQSALIRVDKAATRLVYLGALGAFIAFVLCGLLAWVESGRIAAMNHEINERKLAQSRQEQMLRRLESLNQLQKDLLLPGSLDDKLHKITDAAVQLFDLDLCRIWQIGPGDLCSAGCIHATAAEDRHVCPRRDMCLHLTASSGRYTHLDGGHRRVPFGCYKIGRIASGEENKFLINNVTEDPRVHNHEWAKELGLVSFAGYKLRDMRGDPIGVFAMFAKHELSEEEDLFLSTLAETASGVMMESKAEEALRESERRLANIIDFLPDATFVVDCEGKVIAWNHAIEEMTGVRAEQILGQGNHAYAVPFYGEARPALVDLIFENDIETEKKYRSFQRKGDHLIAESTSSRFQDRTETHLWIIAAPLYNTEGLVVGAIESVRDITEQKRAQKALEESEQRLATIIDFLPDGTFAIDRDGRVIAWNHALEELTGVPASEMLGKGDYAYSLPLCGEIRPVLIDLVSEKHDNLLKNYDLVERKHGLLIAEGFLPFLHGGKGAYIWGVAAPLYDSEGRIAGAIESIRDITEKKQAEKALRDSETKYRTVYDAAIDGILVRTPDRKIIAANRAAVVMFGCKDESELMEMPLKQLYPERQPDGELSEEKALHIVEDVQRESQCTFEWNYQRKDGMPFFAMVSLTIMNLEGRNCLLTTIRDITEQKRAEEAVRASETKYRTLYDASSDAILLRTPDRRVVGANRAAVALFGYANEEELKTIVPEDLYSEYQPDGRLSIEKAPFMAEIALREGSYSFEWKYRRKDGTEFLANVLWTRMELEGKPILLTTIRDITKQRYVEESLRFSERRYRLLAENVRDVIWVVDFAGNFTYLSPSAEQLHGIKWEEGMKLKLKDLLPPKSLAITQEQVQEVAAAAKQGKATKINLEMQAFGKNGSVVWIEASGSGMRDDTGQIVAILGVSRDISERKLAEANLALARDEAEAANRAKSQFLATMSHEIRTPMTAILGYAELLMDPTLSPSSRNNYAATIRRSGEHLLGLINDILDLSKIEAGKITLEFGHCNLVALLAEVASLLRPRAKERGIDFLLVYPGRLPENILTDGARLRQAIINLAGNAIKFTEKGSVQIVASFSPDAYHGNPSVQIEVIDTGIGIREEILPQLFRPFNQGDTSVSRKYGGTGLGLAISNHIAHLLGGELSVHSTFGQGSTFTLTIPTGNLDGVPMLENPSEVTLEEREKGWISEVEDLAGARILLAEDGLDNRELIETILHRVGAKVETAENGRIAVEKAGDQAFDLILMDINMPEMDGYEATRILRDRGYIGPIVALTANAMIGDSERCRTAGCDDYLTKPINRMLLIQIIAKYIKSKSLTNGVTTQESATESPGPFSIRQTVVTADHTAEVYKNGEEYIISEYIDDPDMAPIIYRFVERLAGQLDAMRQAITDLDHKEVRHLSHMLKGSAGSYGYQSLTEVCRMLENAAQQQDHSAEMTIIDRVAAIIRAIQNGCSVAKF